MNRHLAILAIALVTGPAELIAQSTRTVTVDIGAEDPAISPDGSEIAISVLGSIFTVPLEGGAATRLTVGDGWSDHPTWSPDGRFLAYAHQRPGIAYEAYKPGRTELIIRNMATGGTRTLYATEHALGQIAYHPTEPKVFFIEDEDQFVAHLRSIGLDRTDLTKVTQGDARAEWSFALSPSGDRVALEHVWRGATDLFLYDLSNDAPQQLTDSPSEEFSVQWSPDGTSLVYLDRVEGVDHLRVRPLEGGDITGSFSSPYSGKQLILHPDGSSAVIVDGRRLYRVDLVTGQAELIPFTAAFDLPAQTPADLVVGHTRLFDGTDAPMRESTHVAVRNGRIDRVWSGPIAPADTAGVDFIDGGGQFLMPGLVDSHYHFWHHWTFAANELLSKGVTTIRDPGAEIAETLNFRDAIRIGLLEGPELYTLGPLIDGPIGYHPMVDVLLDDPEAAAGLVQSLYNLGVDGIKVYHSLREEVLRAVVSAARELDLPVTGDIGCYTRWETVVDAGVTGLNHAYVYQYSHYPEALTPCRAGEPLQLMRARQSLLTYEPVDPDRPEVRAVFAQMAREGVAFDPTLGVWNTPDSLRVRLGIDRQGGDSGRLEAYKALVRIAHEEGVTLLAGTDNVNLYDELELYEAAGVPRDAILRAATVNGARWFGDDIDFGTVEVGARAHLLLVEGDPLAQMSDLRNVRLVVKDGRVVFGR